MSISGAAFFYSVSFFPHVEAGQRSQNLPPPRPKTGSSVGQLGLDQRAQFVGRLGIGIDQPQEYLHGVYADRDRGPRVGEVDEADIGQLSV